MRLFLMVDDPELRDVALQLVRSQLPLAVVEEVSDPWSAAVRLAARDVPDAIITTMFTQRVFHTYRFVQVIQPMLPPQGGLRLMVWTASYWMEQARATIEDIERCGGEVHYNWAGLKRAVATLGSLQQSVSSCDTRRTA